MSILVEKMMVTITLDFFIAIAIVESGMHPDAVGDRGKAIGIVQISEICVDDVNRIYDLDYTYDDRWDIQKSEEIFNLYLKHWGWNYYKTTNKPPSERVMARIWNGGPEGWKKPSTIKYWDKVKLHLKGYGSKKDYSGYKRWLR